MLVRHASGRPCTRAVSVPCGLRRPSPACAYTNRGAGTWPVKLQLFAHNRQESEANPAVHPKYRNPQIGASSPIRVVNQIVATGDGAHGVKTAAYNLPNDDRVIEQKGSKRVMLKNVQEAKFKSILVPIANRLLAKSARKDVSFDAFFTHILAHELSHGIGPHQIQVAGRSTTVRPEMKELYGGSEEAKDG